MTDADRTLLARRAVEVRDCGRVDGEDERGTRAGMRGDRGLAQRKLCMHAGDFRRGESSSGLQDFGEDISLLGAAGSGRQR